MPENQADPTAQPAVPVGATRRGRPRNAEAVHGDVAGVRENPRRRHLSVAFAGSGFIVWLFRNPDCTIAEVAASGFLAFAAGMLEIGDHIHLNCRDGGAIAVVHRLRPVELRLMCSSVPPAQPRRVSAATLLRAIETAVAKDDAG